jgi:hypothetical protein
LFIAGQAAIWPLAPFNKALYDAAPKQTVIGVREISENLMLPPQR